MQEKELHVESLLESSEEEQLDVRSSFCCCCGSVADAE